MPSSDHPFHFLVPVLQPTLARRGEGALHHRGGNPTRSDLPAPFTRRLPAATLSREWIVPNGSPSLHREQPPNVLPRLSSSSPIGESSTTLSRPSKFLLSTSSPSSPPMEAAIISVRGNQFRLVAALDQTSACTGAYRLAEQYHACLTSSQPDLIPLPALCNHLDTLRVFFAPSFEPAQGQYAT